jgi:hypothetical protein
MDPRACAYACPTVCAARNAAGCHTSDMSQPVLRPGERVIRTRRAAHSQASRAVGGRLLVTNQRVAFYPGSVDRILSGDQWQCELGSIVNVGIAERGSNPFDGSLRKRLRIDTNRGHEYFVITNARQAVAEITSASGIAPTPLTTAPAPEPPSPKYATIVVAAQAVQFGLFLPRSRSAREAVLYALFAIAFAVAAMLIHQRRPLGRSLAIISLVAVVAVVLVFGSRDLPVRLALCVVPCAAIPIVALTAARRTAGDTR